MTYLNEYATFVDKNTIKTTNKKGVEKTVTAAKFIIATGGRPRYPEIPGVELGISSDDLFSLPHSPGEPNATKHLDKKSLFFHMLNQSHKLCWR